MHLSSTLSTSRLERSIDYPSISLTYGSPLLSIPVLHMLFLHNFLKFPQLIAFLVSKVHSPKTSIYKPLIPFLLCGGRLLHLIELSGILSGRALRLIKTLK